MLIQISLLVLVGLLGSYFTYPINFGLFCGFVAAWGIISTVTVAEVRGQLRSISRNSSSAESDIDGFNERLVTTSSKFPTPRNDTTVVGRLFATLQADLGQIATNASSFFPFMSKFERALEVDQFMDRFSFALKRYDFDSYSLDAKRAFLGRVKLTTNKTAWLGGLSEAASSIYGEIPSVLFRLMYYETWDRENIKATWAEVKGDSKEDSGVRDAFAMLLISKNLVDSQGLDEGARATLSDILFGMEDYTLLDFKTRATEFYHNLRLLKEECLKVLDSYDLSIAINRESITGLSPPSSDPTEWQEGVIKYIADQVHQKIRGENLVDLSTKTGGGELPSTAAVETLILVEGVGDVTREQIWKSIFNSETSNVQIRYLASLIAKKRVFRLHKEFSREAFIEHLTLVLRSSPDDFRLGRVEEGVESLEQEILRVKRGVARTNERMRFGLSDVSFVDSFVPKKISEVEEEVVREFAKVARDVNPDVTRLLYFYVIGSDKGLESFSAMVNSKNLGPLADFLVVKGFVPKRRFNEYLVLLLAQLPSFDLASFSDSYNIYEKLFSKISTFHAFLERHQIAVDANLPSFSNILSDSGPKRGLDFPLLFFEVGLTMVSKKLDQITLSDEQHSELAKAASALSLSLENDRASEKLAEDLFWELFGAKVLFNYSKLYVANISRDKATLKEAALETVANPNPDPSFPFYREKLHSGIVVLGEDTLLAMRRTEFESILKRDEKLGLQNEVLQNYAESIKEFMSKIDVNVAREFLSAGVLTAYILTIPHSTALIEFMRTQENAIEAAEEDLAGIDSGYLRLRQFESGSGAGTRIGLVPYGMTFEDFAAMFEDLFVRAKQITKTTKPLNFYITRVFPSNDALREVMQGGSKANPLEVIRDLVRRYIVGSDALSVLSLLEPSENSPTAFNTVISGLINNKSNNLFTLTSDLISDILEKDSAMRTKFESGMVDESLRAAYGSQSLTELCKKVETLTRVSTVDLVKQEFIDRLYSIIPDIGDLPQESGTRLTDALFKRIYVVGTVLNS